MRTSHLLLSLFSLATSVACFGELDIGSGGQTLADRDAGAPAPNPTSTSVRELEAPARDAGSAPSPGFVVETVANVQGYATGIALDAAYIYWSEHTANPNAFSYVGQAKRAPLAGGAATTLLTGLRSAYQIALSGSDVFVGDTLPFDGSIRQDGRIVRVASTGVQSDLVTGLTRTVYPTAVQPTMLTFADTRGVYYADPITGHHGTFRVDPASGATSLVGGLYGSSMCALKSGVLAFGSEGMFIADGAPAEFDRYGKNFACAGANLVGVRSRPVAGNLRGELVVVSPADGSTLRVLSTVNDPLSVGLAADATHVYYTETVGASSPPGAALGGLYRIALGGGTAELVALAGAGSGDGIRLPRVNNTHVYWADTRNGTETLRRAAK